MTKDELKQEAEEYALDTYEMCVYQDLPYASDRRARVQAFLAGAEPRERQIAELKEINADLKQSLDWANEREHNNYVKIQSLEEEKVELQNQYKIEKEKWYAEYTAMYSDFQKHIEELEKENGTLKERCDILDESLITSTKNNIERQKIIDEHNDQFTKAKELLSRLKSDFKNFAFEVGITLVSETYFEVEKFLKESE